MERCAADGGCGAKSVVCILPERRKTVKFLCYEYRQTYQGSKRNSEFHRFFVDAMKDIYWAEKHLDPALLKMEKAATDPGLAAAFKKHNTESARQIQLVEQVFELLGVKPAAKKCEAMAGLIKEAEEIIADTERDSFVRDAGLILAAQKVEHYEIATYGTLVALADFLPERGVKKLLAQILQNEKDTDAGLTRIAEQTVNACAALE